MEIQKVSRDSAKHIRDIAQACAIDLTQAYGEGHWSKVRSLQTVRRNIEKKDVYLCRLNSTPVATFALSAKKPVFISAKLFSKPDEPYAWLTDLYVHPDYQRKGIGKKCMAAIRKLLRSQERKWLRFDAYDAKAGACEFYLKCDCTLIGKATASGTKLLVYEVRV